MHFIFKQHVSRIAAVVFIIIYPGNIFVAILRR
jgi:hypothetical protein